MKLGLISDVHGDIEALERAWAHLEGMGVDRVVSAGDSVGYGPEPDRVVAFLAEHRIDAVRGNHDRWALERGPGQPDEFGGGTPGAATLEALRGLPFDLLVADGAKVGVVVHGSPESDMEFVGRSTHPAPVLRGYLGMTGADLLVVGHTHRPMWYRCDLGLVVNPGSIIAKPVVESSKTFAVVDLAGLSVVFHDAETGLIEELAPWPDEPGP